MSPWHVCICLLPVHCDILPNGRNQANDWSPYPQPRGPRLPPQVRSSIPPTFPLLQRGPWVGHISPSLHSKPSSSGSKLSLLMLPRSTDTAQTGIKIHSQPYLAHLFIQNMCLSSFPLHSHLFRFESTLSTQRERKRRRRKKPCLISDVFFFFSAD